MKPVIYGEAAVASPDYQEFRFRCRIHMSLVSTVSHKLMDKCEAERNPITLAGVKALEEAHMKCCLLNVLSVGFGSRKEVSEPLSDLLNNRGAEAWRLIHTSYAPDTQNRQYVPMHKIMMPAKLYCDLAEGFESGLRA